MPGVCQVPDGVENREKWRKLVVESSVVPQMTPTVKGDVKVKEEATIHLNCKGQDSKRNNLQFIFLTNLCP